MYTKFTLLQRFRNKVKLKGSYELLLAKNAKIVNCTISIIGNNNRLTIEDNTVLRYTNIEILGDNCLISIGANSIMGHGCYLSAKEGKKLQIGSGCMFSRNAKVMTSDGHFIYKDDKIINAGKDISIGSNVWLADNVTVLKGVNIGDGSVVGINATLTTSIQAKSIAVGNPAQVVKENIVWKI